jgi:hypothetical protein
VPAALPCIGSAQSVLPTAGPARLVSGGVENITHRPSLDQSFAHALRASENSGLSRPVPSADFWYARLPLPRAAEIARSGTAPAAEPRRRPPSATAMPSRRAVASTPANAHPPAVSQRREAFARGTDPSSGTTRLIASPMSRKRLRGSFCKQRERSGRTRAGTPEGGSAQIVRRSELTLHRRFR